jgi:hypothetical protein
MTAASEAERSSWVFGFHALLGLALLAHVAQDIWAGAWLVHEGVLFPWRHPGLVPLYAAPWLLLEWGVTLTAGLGLWRERTRWPAACLGVAVLFVSCLQRFSNQKALLLVCLVYLVTGGRRPRAEVYRLLRWQLLLVYLFSALSKIRAGFLDGATLEALGLGLGAAVLFSWVVVVAELAALPLLLLRAPKAGVAGVLLLHVGFALLMPGLWPFTLAMLALATLFLERAPV